MKAKFSILCNVIFLVKFLLIFLQGTFEIDHSWE